jgi:branched-chain amino acid transport system ATP-binding protein
VSAPLVFAGVVQRGGFDLRAELVVAPGEVVAVLGPNGAGKSSLLLALYGSVRAGGGVEVDGTDVSRLRATDRARAGIALVPQGRQLFPRLTVRENLQLMADLLKLDRGTVGEALDRFPILRQRAKSLAGVLSGGEQQMLTLCRTLMGDPDLIMIDEPTEGLAPKIVELVAEYLRELRRRGISVLLVEQKLTIALEVSERCLVMGHGQIVFEGTPAALKADAYIRKEWLEV